MTWLTRLLVRRRRGDDGVALITAVMFLAVVAALGAASTVVAVNAAQNANRDRQAGGALQTAEAGVAQGLELLHNEPAGYFTCQEPAAGAAPTGACTTNPAGWTSSTSPEKVSQDGTVGSCVPGQACYAVWVGTVSAYTPASGSGTYRIHSTGLYGGGPAARSVAVDVKVKPAKFPIGVYADDASSGGSFGINRESLFTKGCLDHRVFDSYDATYTPNTTSSGGGIAFSGIDPQYDLPAAAHAIAYVTQANGGCSSATTKSWQQANVHDSSQSTAGLSWSPCNTNDYYDQDAQGGDLATSPCYKRWTSPTNPSHTYPTTSTFTLSDLQGYGYRPGGLSATEYASLKTAAQASGTYFTTPTAGSTLFTALTAANATNGVVYYDLPSTSGTLPTVTVKPGDIPSMYFRATQDTDPCPLQSLVIVVRNGNFKYDTSGGGAGSGYLVLALFVPEGSYTGQGNANVLGTLFANSIGSATGNQNWNLDTCFVKNPPGPVMTVTVTSYREVDTANVQ